MSGYHNELFPTGISYGSQGGPRYNTATIETDSGHEERVSRWSHPRHEYDVSKGFESFDDVTLVKDFFIRRRGPAYGFPFLDEADSTSAANNRDDPTYLDRIIGYGDGATVAFQLQKDYGQGTAWPTTRKISKPQPGTVTVAVDGVEATTGWTVNNDTGVVEFDDPPAEGAVVSAGYRFWVPVRFDQDKLSVSHDAFESGSIPAITLVELVDDEPLDADAYYGGAGDYTFAANFTVSAVGGRVQKLEATATGLSVRLPDPADLAPGGPYFYLDATPGSESFTLKDENGDSLLTMGPGDSCVVCLGRDAGGDKHWEVV